jgi:6,7-dimethyl-8-ribityllumazine synthase
MPEYTGTPSGTGRRIAVVVARFNETITQKLLDGALDALTRHGVAFDDIDVLWVPGAFELPFAARRALASDRYDALVALGAVIRGDTPHFDFVSKAATDGLREVMLSRGVPIGFGVLTTNTVEQAIERAAAGEGNKGAEAAETVLEMARVLEALRPPA